MEKANLTTTWTQENTLELIRKLRNELIKDFLDERHLILYFSDKFNMRDLSRVKVEFLKKDLKQLLSDPIDVNHYQELISQINETCSASISEKYESLFLKDVEKVLRKYSY